MTEQFKTALLNFIRGVYNTDQGIPESAHNLFLDIVVAADDEEEYSLVDALRDIQRSIDATDGFFYIPQNDDSDND